MTDTHLGVEHAVGGQDVEEVLLPVVVPLPEHLVVAVGPDTESSVNLSLIIPFFSNNLHSTHR